MPSGKIMEVTPDDSTVLRCKKLDRSIFPFYRSVKNLLISKISFSHLIGMISILIITLLVPHLTRAEVEPLKTDMSPLLQGQTVNQLDNKFSSLDNALVAQRAERSNLQEQLEQLKKYKKLLLWEINAYEDQYRTYNYLVLQSEPQLEIIENALHNNKLVSKKLVKHLDKLQEHHDSTLLLFINVIKSIELLHKDITDIQKLKQPHDKKQDIETKIQLLIQVLEEKKQVGDSYLNIYEDLSNQIKAILNKQKPIIEKLLIMQAHQKKSNLFKRTNINYETRVDGLTESFSSLQYQIGTFFEFSFWQAQWVKIKNKGFGQSVFFLLLTFSTLYFQMRIRFILQRIEKCHQGPDWYYRQLGLFLTHRTLPFLAMMLLSGIYGMMQTSLAGIGLGRILFQIFLLLFLTQCGMEFLSYHFGESSSRWYLALSLKLKRLFPFICLILILNILLTWLTGQASPLTWLVREFSLIVLLIWTVFFWKQITSFTADKESGAEKVPSPQKLSLFRGWSYLVTSGAIVSSLLGYKSLSVHWLFSWIGTIAILFIGWITLNIIREWDSQHQNNVVNINKENLSSKDVLRWSLIKVIRLTCFIILVSGIILAWDNTGGLFPLLKRIFDLSASVGSFKVSIKGIILAVSVIFITHIVVQLGRVLLKEKILEKRELEKGFIASILSITSYIIWSLGLIFALGILGVNTASLTMVFGALSIGIGFGLQTIFNNFISGLILLFERPIQVGDTIEINGIMAEVKKINVRATIVETFDNASVIVPNSELISNQVINWSFNNKKIRRNLEVGVAYGSDIDLVQKSILKIATNMKGVMAYPQPSVIFIDHADSALIFRLRLWVHINDFWLVPSSVRVEIDKLFRELGIEIAFPQRDLHVRTLPEEIVTSEKKKESEE